MEKPTPADLEGADREELRKQSERKAGEINLYVTCELHYYNDSREQSLVGTVAFCVQSF